MGSVRPTKTLSVSVERQPEKVYDFVSNPANLPKWAPAFCLTVKRTQDGWIAETPDGPMAIRFVDRNDFGVLDHYVKLSPDDEVFNPMRVLPNGQGSEVTFTLFQRPGMTDGQFAEDAGMVERDLRTLKNVLEETV